MDSSDSDQRAISSYTGGSSSLFTGGSGSVPPTLPSSSNPYIQQMQADILQIAHGHAEIARDLYKAIENLTLLEGQTLLNILKGLAQMFEEIQHPDVRAGFEIYLHQQLTISIGHLRGVTNGTITHLSRLLARTLEPPPAPPPPAPALPEPPKGLIRRLFG